MCYSVINVQKVYFIYLAIDAFFSFQMELSNGRQQWT